MSVHKIHSHELSGAALPLPERLDEFLNRETALDAAERRLIDRLATAVTAISEHLRGARLRGHTDQVNVHGETVHKVDIVANEILLEHLADSSCAALVSEELPEAHEFDTEGGHLVVCDPLDGSSNLDVDIPTGTIFGVFDAPPASHGPSRDARFSQRGRDLAIAGYALYSSSTTLVLCFDDEVHSFYLEPQTQAFHLARRGLVCPPSGNIYSVNEGNLRTFHPAVRAWCHSLKTPTEENPTQYTQRYVGSLVADAHRTLLKGGIFAYPPTASHPEGKLRLLYEALPMARIFETAGGTASTGRERLIDRSATSLHERVPLILGSVENVAQYEAETARASWT